MVKVVVEKHNSKFDKIVILTPVQHSISKNCHSISWSMPLDHYPWKGGTLVRDTCGDSIKSMVGEYILSRCYDNTVLLLPDAPADRYCHTFSTSSR